MSRGHLDASEMELFEAVEVIAVNEGSTYQKPLAAAWRAFEVHKRCLLERLQEDWDAVLPCLVEALNERWKEES